MAEDRVSCAGSPPSPSPRHKRTRGQRCRTCWEHRMWLRLASNSLSSPECWVTDVRHHTQLCLAWLWHSVLTLRLADLPKIFHSETSSTFVLVTLFNTSLPCSPKNRCVCVHTSAFHSTLCQISSQSVPLPSVSAMVSNMGHTYVCLGVAPSKKS